VNDAMQWLINLMSQDVSSIVLGLLALFTVLELIIKFKEWLEP